MNKDKKFVFLIILSIIMWSSGAIIYSKKLVQETAKKRQQAAKIREQKRIQEEVQRQQEKKQAESPKQKQQEEEKRITTQKETKTGIPVQEKPRKQTDTPPVQTLPQKVTVQPPIQKEPKKTSVPSTVTPQPPTKKMSIEQKITAKKILTQCFKSGFVSCTKMLHNLSKDEIQLIKSIPQFHFLLGLLQSTKYGAKLIPSFLTNTPFQSALTLSLLGTKGMARGVLLKISQYPLQWAVTALLARYAPNFLTESGKLGLLATVGSTMLLGPVYDKVISKIPGYSRLKQFLQKKRDQFEPAP